MMAFDRTPASPELDPQTIAALRDTLQRSATRGVHDDGLRDVLCRAADEARQKGIQAEHLLLVLKDIWYSLPRFTTAASVDTSHTLLQELVSRCIHEYYSI
jgi:5-methylcytosine-specific restriction endonuclease McrBC regulatory subunit McrC